MREREADSKPDEEPHDSVTATLTCLHTKTDGSVNYKHKPNTHMHRERVIHHNIAQQITDLVPVLFCQLKYLRVEMFPYSSALQCSFRFIHSINDY